MARVVNSHQREPRLLLIPRHHLDIDLLPRTSGDLLPIAAASPRLQLEGVEFGLAFPRHVRRPSLGTGRVTRQVQVTLVDQDVDLVGKQVLHLGDEADGEIVGELKCAFDGT